MHVDLVGLVNQLRATLGKMEVALSSLADAIVWTGQDGQVQWCNAAFDQLVNRPHILVLGVRLSELLPLSQSAQALTPEGYPDARVFADGYETTEYELVHSDGCRVLQISGNRVESADGDRSAVLVIRDITQAKQMEAECRQAEAALRRSEAKFRSLFANSQMGIYRARLDDGLILEANQRFVELVGYASAVAVIGKKSGADFYPDLDCYRQAVQELRRYGQLNNFELQFRRGDQQLCWGLFSIHLNLEENCVEGIVIDITARKQTEEALRRSELKYRNLFENSQVGIGRTRLNDGLFLDANQRYAEIMGFSSAADLIGRRFTTEFYADPDDRWRILTELQQYGEVRNFEEQLHRADGSVAWGLLSLRPNPEESCLEFVITDITKRKQAEALLRQREQEFRALVENAPDTIVRFDREFHYLYINPRVERETGVPPSAFIGKTMQEMGFSESLVCLWQVTLERVFETAQEEAVEYEFPYLGKITYQAARVVPEFGGDGSVESVLVIIRDITERKRLEAELLQSQKFLDSVIENIPLALFVKDIAADFRYVLINQYSERVLGFARDRAIGLNDHDLIAPEVADEYRAQDLAAVKLGTVLEIPEQWAGSSSDSKKILVQTWKLPLFDTQGTASHLLCICEDITERKQREEALRLIVEGTASKTGDEFFRSFVRYLAEVLRVRYALVTEFANQAQASVRTLAFWAGETLGENFEYELHGTPCADVFRGRMCHYPQELQSLFFNNPKLAELGAESYLGIPLTNSSGHLLGHLVVLDVKPMQRDPGRELILQIFAVRAGAELERKQAEEKFTKAFRASPSPIAITTLAEGRFIDVNSSFLRMSGYALEAVMGHTATDLNLWLVPEIYHQAIQHLLETGSLHNQELEFRSRSGEVRVVLLSIELIDLAGAQCALNIVNDITERKRLENELISLVSHELRTPLTSLLGALDLLGAGRLGTLTAQGQQVLSIATTNTERLTRLVNDILDLERMKSGQLTLRPVRCNAFDLLTQAADAMRAMADQAQIALIAEPLSAELLADPDRILQALTNLLGNAIKFSNPGSTIWLGAYIHSGQLQIQVRDQGRGIPADKRQAIFERFQQVDASDSRNQGGTGLGLAICRNIIEQHEGKIWVESVLGQGSTFQITLPLWSENGAW